MGPLCMWPNGGYLPDDVIQQLYIRIYSRLHKKILSNDVADELKNINCAIERVNLFL